MIFGKLCMDKWVKKHPNQKLLFPKIQNLGNKFKQIDKNYIYNSKKRKWHLSLSVSLSAGPKYFLSFTLSLSAFFTEIRLSLSISFSLSLSLYSLAWPTKKKRLSYQQKGRRRKGRPLQKTEIPPFLFLSPNPLC